MAHDRIEPMGPDEARAVDAYLTLELSASEPYTRFVYGDAAAARSAHRRLFGAGGEFGPPFGRVVRDGAEVVAMAAWSSGTELRRARLRSGVALVGAGVFDRDPGSSERARLAAGVLCRPRADDLYLSRLAVAVAARGRGLGGKLLAELEADAARRSCGRLVLEVSPEHEAARKLYRRSGFEEVARHEVIDPATSRALTYLHLVKICPA